MTYLKLSAILLTAAEEVLLARRIQSGGEDGKAAKEQLVRGNLRLAAAWSRRYSTRGLDADDLFQEAVFGLIRAAETFNPDIFGTRFSTYATRAIRIAISKSIRETSNFIRVPAYLLGQVGNVDQLSKEQAFCVAAASRALRCLDQSWDMEGSFDTASHEHPPDKQLADAEMLLKVRQAIDTLPERDQMVVRFRYFSNKTLAVTGRQLGISDERVRQLELEAIAKLSRAMLRNKTPARVITILDEEEKTMAAAVDTSDRSPTPREERLLGVVEKCYRPGDVVPPARLANAMGVTTRQVSHLIVRLRDKGLWPYRSAACSG